MAYNSVIVGAKNSMCVFVSTRYLVITLPLITLTDSCIIQVAWLSWHLKELLKHRRELDHVLDHVLLALLSISAIG